MVVDMLPEGMLPVDSEPGLDIGMVLSGAGAIGAGGAVVASGAVGAGGVAAVGSGAGIAIGAGGAGVASGAGIAIGAGAAGGAGTGVASWARAAEEADASMAATAPEMIQFRFINYSFGKVGEHSGVLRGSERCLRRHITGFYVL